jgi:hypothetical protein
MTEQQREAWLEKTMAELHADKEAKRLKAKRKSARDAMRKRRRTLERKNVRHVQEWRAKKKKEAKAARTAENKRLKTERVERRAIREAKKALDLRKHATQHAGFIEGFQTKTPQSDSELKAMSWSQRYRTGYSEGAAEKRRYEAILNQYARPTPPASVAIRLS